MEDILFKDAWITAVSLLKELKMLRSGYMLQLEQTKTAIIGEAPRLQYLVDYSAAENFGDTIASATGATMREALEDFEQQLRRVSVS